MNFTIRQEGNEWSYTYDFVTVVSPGEPLEKKGNISWVPFSFNSKIYSKTAHYQRMTNEINRAIDPISHYAITNLVPIDGISLESFFRAIAGIFLPY